MNLAMLLAIWIAVSIPLGFFVGGFMNVGARE